MINHTISYAAWDSKRMHWVLFTFFLWCTYQKSYRDMLLGHIPSSNLSCFPFSTLQKFSRFSTISKVTSLDVIWLPATKLEYYTQRIQKRKQPKYSPNRVARPTRPKRVMREDSQTVAFRLTRNARQRRSLRILWEIRKVLSFIVAYLSATVWNAKKIFPRFAGYINLQTPSTSDISYFVPLCDFDPTL